MEEGRRMFQIFAARMFEQRVLTAYREKVARERQQKLIEEEMEDEEVAAQREAKKAKEAQKKKDKKKQQKQAKDEEKAKREAEKAAEEAAVRAVEEKKAEELRQKKEEQRRKREAEKKAQEEEKQRKEAEKQKRLQEAKDLQLEQERKKKKKEEAKKKEREEREAKEKEAKEKKEREAKAKAGSGAKDKSKVEERAARTPAIAAQALPMRTAAAATAMAPPGLLPSHSTSSHNSPHLPIATPVVPKPPAPIRARQSSFQDTRTTSPKTSIPPTPGSTTSPIVPSALHNGITNNPTMVPKQPTPPQLAQAQNRYSPKETSPGSTTRPPGFSSMPANSGAGFGPSDFLRDGAQTHQSHPYPYNNPMGPNGMPYSSNMNAPRVTPQGRMERPPLQTSANAMPGGHFGDIGQQLPHRDSSVSHTHSRNTSTSSNVAAPTQPIARPAPIQPPSSANPQQQGRNGMPTNKDQHLGSSALLGDDDDLPLPLAEDSRRGSAAPLGRHPNGRPAFGGPPAFPPPIGTRNENLSRGIHGGEGTFSAGQSPFGNAPNPWPPTPGFGRPNNGNTFGSIGSSGAQSTSRAITVRILLTNTCQKLTARSAAGPMVGWHPIESITRDVNINKPQNLAPINQMDILSLCNTAGNAQNGGGTFEVTDDPGMGVLIHFQPGRTASMAMPGEIGSPINGSGGMFGNPRPFAQQGFPPSTGF